MFRLQKLLTVREVAELLRISNMTVYRLLKGGHLPAVRVGKNYRIKEEDVRSYIDRGPEATLGLSGGD